MAWWNEILQLLRDEANHHAGQLGATEQLREAQRVLERTTAELDDASARAEAARRRMRNAQQELEALAAKPQRHASYAERLTDLARAFTHETELVATFDAHIARLAQLRDRMDAQLRQLQRDLSMVESAAGAAATSRAAEAHEQSHEPTRHGDKPAGFRQQQPKAVMDALDALPRKRKKRSDEG
jgi:chromosome segregation ATPase